MSPIDVIDVGDEPRRYGHGTRSFQMNSTIDIRHQIDGRNLLMVAIMWNVDIEDEGINNKVLIIRNRLIPGTPYVIMEDKRGNRYDLAPPSPSDNYFGGKL